MCTVSDGTMNIYTSTLVHVHIVHVGHTTHELTQGGRGKEGEGGRGRGRDGGHYICTCSG